MDVLIKYASFEIPLVSQKPSCITKQRKQNKTLVSYAQNWTGRSNIILEHCQVLSYWTPLENVREKKTKTNVLTINTKCTPSITDLNFSKFLLFYEDKNSKNSSHAQTKNYPTLGSAYIENSTYLKKKRSTHPLCTPAAWCI